MASSISNASSKYKDIISKSTLISSGSPAVYQLRPKEVKFGSLTRKTVGEKNLDEKNRTILLVGETGTGKSTLINALFNYTMGVKFEDNIWFEIVEDEKRGQIESQTSDVITYEIFGYEDKTLPYSLTIIDTPGYGSTEGIENDVIVSQRLFDLFSSDDGVHEINAVGLVLKASENRLSDRLRYIFDSVTSLFGKDIEKNIVALITHSDGRRPKNALKALEAANIKFAKDEKKQPVHFLFDNCQSENRIEELKELKDSYDVTLRGLGRLTDFMERTAPQELGMTIEVLNARIQLTACIHNLQERIELNELKQKEIQQTEEALKEHQQGSEETITIEVDEVYKEKENIDCGMWWLIFYQGAICCEVCKENCHYPCTLAWNPGQCKVMKKGSCTVCTKKCPASAHVKDKMRYVNKTRKVKKTLEELKQKYEAKHQKIEDLLLSLKTEKEKLDREKNVLLDESYQYVVKLEKIALNVNSLSTHVHLDFLIEKMKERGDTEKVKKLEEGVMWRLVLVVSLLCCSSEASVSCKDENGAEVDWYILYKTPKSRKNQLTGLDYVYIYPDNNNKVKSRLNTKPINDPNGILAYTLRQHLDYNKASPTPNFGFISYSDQPPKDVKPRPGHSHGHSKGVVMMEKNNKGLWLLHSTPRFPQIGQNFYPESGTKKGQTFICVTFNYDQFKAIGTHLQYINAFPYHQHIPPDFHGEFQQPKPGHKRTRRINISNDFKTLTSDGGKDFNSIAKLLSKTGDPEVGDLYVTISKAVGSDVRVQTWGCQKGRDSPFCPTSGKKVHNIQSVQPDSKWKEWGAKVDHSKWCVAMDQNKPWTCIADVNRSKSQYGRPGGALCVKDEEIAKIFRTFVKSVDNCSGRGKRDTEICPDPDEDLDPEPEPDSDSDSDS
ncbi:uncharacterized protein LOC122968138 [Scomber scombrus]|uniref:deoxyribonuclease II n=1 Tax=Scomber scombrus TaxID=13677 RepID=A0AAV1QAK8_SCOSC